MPRLTGFDSVPIRGAKALPFIGVQTNALGFLADPVGRMIALHREFGDIAAVTDRSPALVCAFGAERNREVLSNAAVFENDDAFFFKAPPGSAFHSFKSSLVFLTGATARRHRRLMMPAFQKASVDGYAAAIVAVTRAALQTWPVGRTSDIAALTRELVQHVAVRCFFGLDWATGDRELGDLATETLDRMTSPLTAALPFHFPGSAYSRLLETSEQLVDQLRALIAKKRRQPEGGRDALALMIAARDEDGSMFTDEELVAEAATLFIAGHDTQAKTLAWTLFLLEQHPKVLADVLDEIESVLRGDPPTVEQVPRLKLVDRVLKESMRVLAPVPTLFIRVCQTEARLGPYTLPKHANVVLSPFITHRDPEVYPEPARFRPERWERLQPALHEYLPFGAGPRMCLGAGVATLTLRLVLPMILQRYRLTLAHGARVSRRVRGNILGPKHGLPMLIAPQDRRFVRREGVRGDIHELVDLS